MAVSTPNVGFNVPVQLVLDISLQLTLGQVLSEILAEAAQTTQEHKPDVVVGQERGSHKWRHNTLETLRFRYKYMLLPLQLTLEIGPHHWKLIRTDDKLVHWAEEAGHPVDRDELLVCGIQ